MADLLLASADANVAARVAAYLTSKGHHTDVVADARQAIAHIREKAPRILVTDLMLPFGDGFQIVTELRQHHPTANVGIIMVTTIQADGEPGRDWRLPIDAYVLRHDNASVLTWQIVLVVEQLLDRPG